MHLAVKGMQQFVHVLFSNRIEDFYESFYQNNMLQGDSEVTLDLKVISRDEATPFSSAISCFMELSISLYFNSFQYSKTWSDYLVGKHKECN